MLEILSLLEEYGHPMSEELARAVVRCDDAIALEELEKINVD